MTTNISTYLKFANLQMAAESLFAVTGNNAPAQLSATMTEGTLTKGNDRSSKFTDLQSTQFAQDWEVVEHKSNTTTGFSGTLFRATRTDTARGITQGERNVSMTLLHLAS